MSTAAAEQHQRDMQEIRELAATRKHHLAPHMTGSRPLTSIQAGLILAKLRSAPRLTVDEAAEPAPASRETRAAAASGGLIPPPLSAFKDMPEGYYAVRRGETEVIDYFLIEEGKGKWAGTKFARRVLGGQPASARKLRTERMENMQQRVAMQRITTFGLEASQELFADTLERCTDCSTPLTDPVSRAARKGPYCRNKSR